MDATDAENANEVMPNPMRSRFDGRAVLVTGSGHGIGRACALRLAEEGARVAVADLDWEAATQTVAALPSPSRHLPVQIDITDTGSVDAAFSQAIAHFGRLDALINVAGGDTTGARFPDADDAAWERMLDLNLLGAMRCCRAAVPHLKASASDPSIVSVGSVNGQLALGGEPYSAAKAALYSLMQNLAASLGPEGIRVNSVSPGTVRTRVWDSQPGGADGKRSMYPLGRVGEPEDIAAAVAFLASSDASWITGHVLPVDGGLVNATTRMPG